MTEPSTMNEHHLHVEPSVINDYDLDVVDEALLHPEKPEYIDHFGFTVQVKTDNEYDIDTSDSEYEDASSNKNTTTNGESLAVNENGDCSLPVSPNNNSITIKEEEIKSKSYYDLLVSKSTTFHHDSEKQVKLKQETTHNLELLKENSLQEETDWGKKDYIQTYIQK